MKIDAGEALLEHEMLDVLKEACKEAGGVTAWCELHDGLDRELVYKVLQGKNRITARISLPLGYDCRDVRVFAKVEKMRRFKKALKK